MRSWMALPVILTLASLACSVDLYGTPTPAPAASAPPATMEAAATAVPTEVPVDQSQRFFVEEFDVENPSWQYMVVNGSSHEVVNGIVGLMSVRTAGGLQVFDLQGPEAWVYSIYEPQIYSDVRLDVHVNNRGVNNNNVSLICRMSEAGWFEFNIANNGLYEVLYGKRSGDAVEYIPIADGGSGGIRNGMAENEYGITCQGNILTLFINGEQARRLEDKKFLLPEGKVGIAVSSFRDVPVTVDVFKVSISEP